MSFCFTFYVAWWSRYSSPMAEELRLSKLVTSEDRNVEKQSRFEVFEVYKIGIFYCVFFNIGEVCSCLCFFLILEKLVYLFIYLVDLIYCFASCLSRVLGVFRNQKPCWIFVASFCLQLFFLFSSTFRWSERQKSLNSFGSRDRSGGAERGVRTTQDDRDRSWRWIF